VRDEYLRQILEAARWAPTPHNMENFEIVAVDGCGKGRESTFDASNIIENSVKGQKWTSTSNDYSY